MIDATNLTPEERERLVEKIEAAYDNTNGHELDEYGAGLCREINGGDNNAET
ncbi:MAG: hypothetical protein K2N06_08655 [Oscillospiraceae bacterium]|nr:hypothetical protein [Oscillospiraceae bacterium]